MRPGILICFFILSLSDVVYAGIIARESPSPKVNLIVKTTDQEGILLFSIVNNEAFEINIPSPGINVSAMTLKGPNGKIHKRQYWKKYQPFHIQTGKQQEWTFDLNVFFNGKPDHPLGTYLVSWQTTYTNPKTNERITLFSNELPVDQQTALFREQEVILDIRMNQQKDTLLFHLQNTGKQSYETSTLGKNFNKVFIINAAGEEVVYFSNDARNPKVRLSAGEKITWKLAKINLDDQLKSPEKGYHIVWQVQEMDYYRVKDRNILKIGRANRSPAFPINQK